MSNAIAVQGTVGSSVGVTVGCGGVGALGAHGGMGLALNLRNSGNVIALLSAANGEDRALPSLTLAGQLAVLGSLGADTAR